MPSNSLDIMLPEMLKEKLKSQIDAVDHKRELAIDVLTAVQAHYGYLSDAAVAEAGALLEMTPLEIEELATFYTFLYREPVGKYVIHICDSVICWMEGEENLADHLCKKLEIRMGETTADGLFTLLPVCCIGYCDRSPAILVNRKVHGPLTIDTLDRLIEELRRDA